MSLALSERFRVYAVDVIGQPGRTQRRHPAAEGPARIRGLVPSPLLDGLGIERAPVVGCSFGGFLALNQCLADA